ncbi:tetratricopeptide repeat protein 1 isoform X2 [Mauremys reevesii]|uniref:tetratricopeptide repeat protein 1 isoform X2 n=1 Tax=Mauremys reevesii TaxID=260615 RepID=UPI00193EC6B9|nr:tetratricopeptide repeat protein 1 isoform X2 [Mauremys reevesii]
MEETEESSPPEELLHGLKLSDQKSSESNGPLTAGSKDAHNPRSLDRGDLHSSAQEPRAADECFHDCNDSFEVKEPGMEQERDNREDPAGKQTELDEEYLLELEKNMPEEEKQKRRKESTKLKEKGNEQFKKGAIELDPNYIRALLRRAELYEKTEKLDEALEDYKTVLEKDPSVHHAREACMRLPRQIEERNERLKTEMLGKLKDLGNLVLRPFGLSTENFQVKQDSSTGSYSINFVQNPNNNNR